MRDGIIVNGRVDGIIGGADALASCLESLAGAGRGGLIGQGRGGLVGNGRDGLIGGM